MFLTHINILQNHLQLFFKPNHSKSMKQILTMAGLILAANFSFSQNISMKWGENTIPINYDWHYTEVATKKTASGANRYQYYKSGLFADFEMVFEKIDLNGKVLSSKKVEFDRLPNKKDKISLKILSFNENGALAIVTIISKSNSKETLYKLQLNKDARQIGPLEKIEITDDEIDREYVVYKSNDQSKLLILSFESGKKLTWSSNVENYHNENIGVLVLNNDGNKMYSKQIALPLEEKRIFIRNVRLNDNGNFFITIINELNGSNDQFYYLLPVNQNDKGNPQIMTINSEMYPVSEMNITYADNFVYFAGLFNQKKKALANQLFFKKIELGNLKSSTENIIPFNTSYSAILETLDKIDRNIEIRKIRPLPDGTCIVEVVVSNNYSHDPFGKTPDLHNITEGSIYMIKFDNNGQMQWDNIIQKAQYGSLGKFISYSCFLSATNKAYYFYNDHKYNAENTDLKKIKTLAAPKDACFMITIIDLNTGKSSQEKIYCNKNGGLIYPNIKSETDQNSFLFLANPESGSLMSLNPKYQEVFITINN